LKVALAVAADAGQGLHRSNGYGNSIFFRLQPIDFAWLRKIRENRKSQLKALPCGMT
jgi:hypothetical protein